MGSPLAVQPAPASRLVIVGATGSGKSVFRSAYVAPVRRVIVLDPFGEVEMGGGAISVADLEADARAGMLDRGVLRASIWIERQEWSDLPAVLDRTCEATERIGNCLLVVEEISFFAGPSPGQTPPAFARLAVAGRHKGVALAVVAQRFAQIPTVYRAQLSRVVSFRQPDPEDASALARRLAGEIEPTEAQTLRPFHFIDWTPSGGARRCEPLPQTKR